MHRPIRALAATALVAGLSGVPLAAASAAPATPAAFCARVKAHNKNLEATVKKNPRSRTALTTARVQGWSTLAKSAPADVAKGLQRMAATLKQGFPPAQGDMAVVLPYIEQNCKVTLY